MDDVTNSITIFIRRLERKVTKSTHQIRRLRVPQNRGSLPKVARRRVLTLIAMKTGVKERRERKKLG